MNQMRRLMEAGQFDLLPDIKELIAGNSGGTNLYAWKVGVDWEVDTQSFKPKSSK